jgi:hypothetical protein
MLMAEVLEKEREERSRSDIRQSEDNRYFGGGDNRSFY